MRGIRERNWLMQGISIIYIFHTIVAIGIFNLYVRYLFDFKLVFALSWITWAPFQYPVRRLIVRSREVSKPWDFYLKLFDRSEIWQAPRQHCCRCACQISKRCDNSNYQSRSFETSRDLMIRRLIGYWNGALYTVRVRLAQWTKSFVMMMFYTDAHVIFRCCSIRNWLCCLWW